MLKIGIIDGNTVEIVSSKRILWAVHIVSSICYFKDMQKSPMRSWQVKKDILPKHNPPVHQLHAVFLEGFGAGSKSSCVAHGGLDLTVDRDRELLGAELLSDLGVGISNRWSSSSSSSSSSCIRNRLASFDSISSYSRFSFSSASSSSFSRSRCSWSLSTLSWRWDCASLFVNCFATCEMNEEGRKMMKEGMERKGKRAKEIWGTDWEGWR